MSWGSLERPFEEEEEIRRAVWELGQEKSPEPDGFSMALFQSCWDIIKINLVSV